MTFYSHPRGSTAVEDSLAQLGFEPLPAGNEPDADHFAPVGKPEDMPGSRVKLRALVIEDEPADVELALRALRLAGFETTADVTQTLEEFTDLARKHSYDVILADYKLPAWKGDDDVV